MKTINFTLIFIFIFFSLHGLSTTFLFYFAADNGLYENALNDINELEKGIRDSMNVLAFIDHGFPEDTKESEVFLIKRDDSAEITSPSVKKYGETDSGDYHTLVNFVNWGLSNYPAEKTVLVIWSHGTGWYKNKEDSKYICPDNQSENLISIYEGDIKEAFQSFNKKIDLTIMDACLMGNIEVLSEIYDRTNYFIGSEREVPTNGFPWDIILSNWNQYPEEINRYKMVNRSYMESYENGGSQNPYGEFNPSLSVCLAESEYFLNLKTVLKNFCLTVAPLCFVDQTLWEKYSQIRNNCQDFNDLHADIDIMDFFTKMETEKELPDSLLEKAKAVSLSLKKVFIDTHDNTNKSVGSMSIFFPTEIQMLQYLYKNKYQYLSISETQFPYFTNSLIRPDDIAPFPIEDLNGKVILKTLFLTWHPVPDPSPVLYIIEHYENSNLVNTYRQMSSTINFSINQAGFVSIKTLDYSGNLSEATLFTYLYEDPKNATVYIAPNPVTAGKGNIKLFFKEDLHNFDLKIYTQSGDLVGEKKIVFLPSGENTIALSDVYLKGKPLSSGVYLLVLQKMSIKVYYKFAIIR